MSLEAINSRIPLSFHISFGLLTEAKHPLKHLPPISSFNCQIFIYCQVKYTCLYSFLRS